MKGIAKCIIGLLIPLMACSESEIVQSSSFFKLEGLNGDFAPAGETRTIRVSVDGAWKLTSSGNWVTFNTTSGEGTGMQSVEVKATIAPNVTGILRSADITLSDPSGTGGVVCEVLQSEPEATEVRVGDPGVQFAELDPYYPQMTEWIKTGKQGGIPFLASQKATKVFDSSTSMEEIIKYLFSNRSNTIVLLKNGVYTLEKEQELRIYSNCTLIGESKDGVIIEVSSNKNPISLYNANNAGVRNLTLKGTWSTQAPDPTCWEEALVGKGGHRMIDLNCSENCFVDNVKIVNSASHPIWISKGMANGNLRGAYNTIRDVEIDGAYCKGGGCQGYFFIGGDHNLITGCKVIHIRHISMQGELSKLNVLYKNSITQEVSFHANDGGDNLVEHNQITIPTTLQAYNAIMGPWSSQHKVGGKNFIFRNRCIEENRQNNAPWSDNELYIGPYEVSVGDNNPTRYTNFRVSANHPKPLGRTLYPVILK